LGQAGGILAQGTTTQSQQRLRQFPVCHHLTMAFQQAEHLGSQFREGRCLEPSFAGFAQRRREGLSCALCSASFDMPAAKPGRRLCATCGRTAK
jgi:hypothetical protein